MLLQSCDNWDEEGSSSCCKPSKHSPTPSRSWTPTVWATGCASGEKTGVQAKEGRRWRGHSSHWLNQNPGRNPPGCAGETSGGVGGCGRQWEVPSEQPLLGASRAVALLGDRDFGSEKRTRVIQYSIVTTQSVVILYIDHAWEGLTDLSPNSFQIPLIVLLIEATRDIKPHFLHIEIQYLLSWETVEVIHDTVHKGLLTMVFNLAYCLKYTHHEKSVFALENYRASLIRH